MTQPVLANYNLAIAHPDEWRCTELGTWRQVGSAAKWLARAMEYLEGLV